MIINNKELYVFIILEKPTNLKKTIPFQEDITFIHARVPKCFCTEPKHYIN